MKSEWVELKKQKPKQGVSVIIYSTEFGILYCYEYYRSYNGKKGNNFFGPVHAGIAVIRDATHWQPLLEPPKGGGK